jgi:hypothetical protein
VNTIEAAQYRFWGCVAVNVQVPPIRRVTLEPETVQTEVVLDMNVLASGEGEE